MTTELKPLYDSRSSFYGKARVEEYDGDIFLFSYNTQVACIHSSGKATVHNTYSSTTLRHIKEFLLQHGFKAESKKQIEQDYMKGK